MIHIVRKSALRLTKSPNLVLIGLVWTEIQAFKNVKNLQRSVWKSARVSKKLSQKAESVQILRIGRVSWKKADMS